MTMPNGQQPQQAQFHDVPAGPVPMTFTIFGRTIGVVNVVGMRVSTPLGPQTYWLAPDEAIQLSKQLRQYGKTGKIGLALPEGVNLGDGDDEEDAAPADTQRDEIELTLPPADLDAARAMGERQATELLAEQRRAEGGPEITET